MGVDGEEPVGLAAKSEDIPTLAASQPSGKWVLSPRG